MDSPPPHPQGTKRPGRRSSAAPHPGASPMSADSPRSYSSFQQVVLVALRTLIGWHFLYEGMYKLRLPGWGPDGTPLPAWTATGFMKASTGPLGKLAHFALDHGWISAVDKLVMFGVAAVGVSLILGLLTRAGCIGG